MDKFWTLFYSLRRGVCGLCALVLMVGVFFSPAALADDGSDAQQPQQLTAQQALQMEQADAAVTDLTDSDAYAAMTGEERREAAAQTLDELARQGLIHSVYYDSENQLYSFSYACGALGGILLQDFEELEELDQENRSLPVGAVGALVEAESRSVSEQMEAEPEPEELSARTAHLGNAVIYYAFDDPSISSRYPFYTYMQRFWTAQGLDTRLDTQVTLSDLKRMDEYDLCILSAHGLYYTYTYGLFRRTATSPILILNEESSFWKDLLYAGDLLCRRVIKVNGLYCILPEFFQRHYRSGQLSDTLIISETCEFLGLDDSLDFSMAEAFLDGGAPAVLGFVNNVYAIYSRDLMWDTVNQLIVGRTMQQALDHAIETFGANDIEWYLSQAGLHPHQRASYPMLLGDGSAQLYTIEELGLPDWVDAA